MVNVLQIIGILSATLLAMSAQGQEIRIESLPPVVVETVPRSGETMVDAELDEIKVTFSKDMRDGNFSWVRISEKSFPKLLEQPKFVNQRTCVVKVRLQPDQTYAIWLNSDRYKNFKDKGQRPAVPYLLVFRTAP